MKSKKPVVYRRKKSQKDKTKPDKGYSFYFYGPDGKPVYRKTKIRTKAAATEYAEEYVKEYLGQNPPPTLEEYTKDFFIWGRCDWIKDRLSTDHDFGQATAKLRRGKLLNYILPKYGKLRLDDSKINAVDVQRWLRNLPLKNQTKNHIRDTMNIVMRQAKKQRLISENYITEVAYFGNDSIERLPFTIEECQILFPVSDLELRRIWDSYYWASLFHTMLSTGMRSGEIRALLWRDVFWGDCLVINKTVKNNGTVGETKGKKPRSIFLHPDTEDLLKKHKAEFRFSENDDLMWFPLDRTSKYVDRRTLVNHLRKALEQTGIEDKGRTPHSFRHTFNNEARNELAEEPLRFMIGHESRAMTEHYSHYTAREKLLEYQAARNTFNSLWKRR